MFAKRCSRHLKFAPRALAMMTLPVLAGAGLPADVQSNVSRFESLPATCESAGKASSGLAALLEGAKSHPTAQAFSALGLEFARQEQHACAIAAFRAALEITSSSWTDRYNLGLALEHSGDAKDAAAELRGVVQQNPDYFPARHALGLALQSLGDLDAAAEQFDAALHIDPQSGAAAFGLAQVYQAEKKNAAALYYLHRTLASNPPQQLAFQARLTSSAILDETGHADEAVAELRKLVAAFPDSAEAHFNLANEYSLHFRYGEARPEYEQTLRLDPANNAARLACAKAILEIGENAPALPLLRAYIHNAPGDFEGYLVLGQAYRRSNDLARAEPELRHALALKPSSYDAHNVLGTVLAAAGRIEEATVEMQAAEKLNPSAPGAHYELTVLYNKKNDPVRAQEESKAFQQSREQAENARTFDLLRLKGDDALEKGDPTGSASAYQRAIGLNPDDPGIHYDLSLALAKLGDRAGEKQNWRKPSNSGRTCRRRTINWERVTWPKGDFPKPSCSSERPLRLIRPLPRPKTTWALSTAGWERIAPR